MEQKLCPACHSPVADSYYFCPNCGKQLNEPPISLSKQLGVYALSILLPPLGLWPGIKYIIHGDEKTKKVGLIAVILTIFATIVTVWLFLGLMSGLTSGVGSQFNQYQNMGY